MSEEARGRDDGQAGRDAISEEVHGRQALSPGDHARDALTGTAGPRRRRRRRERPVVPEPEFTSYYGRPVVKPPVWKALDIAGYLFLGGLAGASSVLSAGAELTGRPRLARGTRIGAAGAIAVSLAALVHDLGRPARFVNMLRVLKWTSPMSVGSWILSAYAPAAGAAALSAVTGRLPRIGTAGAMAGAVAGPAVAAYTGVLLADTAVPGWHEGHRELPYLFVSSAAGAGGGLGLLVAPLAEAAPARRMGVAGGTAELLVAHFMRRRMGVVAEAYETGRAGVLIRTAEALTGAGALAAVLGRRSRWLSAAAGGALLAGSALTRFGVFEAGMISSKDPKYTVVPQRARLDARDDGNAVRPDGTVQQH
ncbi:NrfD/PsrC family molybdoenzyme membrane anchor subunit [Actinoallomurus soli]|uniref:NrfD/PsrC family molybdoenzyme membrane anchor subunit n=1 Tax=Actinoallomurus soli TaxID=2952535 RepID=UPI002092BD06|nr:NrfD/PsrC family molybdoenzyme membrane anchor subunit [Actinoallomurus soli]MCO5967737.1 polysulfide reductase NrfD [Actinoallomurus soli]